MDTTKSIVGQPLTQAFVDAMPIANNDMSEEELRQICVDFMTLMMRFPWTPSQNCDFINVKTGKVSKTFEEGKVYGGTPYVACRMGNIYSLFEYYDEKTGVLDLSGGMDTIKFFANQCSGSTFWGWNRVCNSARHTNTADMTEVYGCLRVGPYTYSKNLRRFSAKTMFTDDICNANGKQTMFESYAVVKPGDGIVNNHKTDNHVRMVSGYSHVVRDENGLIDGDQSYLVYTDQDGQWRDSTQPDGTPFNANGGYNMKPSFNKLFETGYIPFTFAELNKRKPVTKSKTTISLWGKKVSINRLKRTSVRCNYSLSDITYVVKDAEGKQVYRRLFPVYNIIGIQLRRVHLAPYAIDPEELKPFADGKHTIEISARIGTGEKPVVYTGTLVK